MSELALPWAKARRKRRKPPGLGCWVALAFVVWDLAFGLYDIVFMLLSEGLWIGYFGGCGAFMFVMFGLRDWPWFRREVARWREDDDG